MIRLFDDLGRYVATVEVPETLAPPRLIRYGFRYFLRVPDALGGYTEIHCYTPKHIHYEYDHWDGCRVVENGDGR